MIRNSLIMVRCSTPALLELPLEAAVTAITAMAAGERMRVAA